MSGRAKRAVVDGPATGNFRPLGLKGGMAFSSLRRAGVSEAMAKAAGAAPMGKCISWGIPFRIGKAFLIKDKPVTAAARPFEAEWLVFLHVSDARPMTDRRGNIILPYRGEAPLGEHAADYVVIYADGSEERLPIRRRRETGALGARWGEAPLEAVNHAKPHPLRAAHEQPNPNWGWSQTRAVAGAGGAWVNYLWAWKNPHPEKAIAGFRFEPASGAVVLSAISAGDASSLPVRWETRRKAVLRLPKGTAFDPTLDDKGMLKQIKLDMGQVISAQARPVYPKGDWPRTYNNKVPATSASEVLVEYAAHPDARFHLPGGKTVAAADLEKRGKAGALEAVAPATERVTLEVVDKATRQPVPVKLHVHGEAGEYLAPVDRHRIPNSAWFEDYGVEFTTDERIHYCTYIGGRTVIDLPAGRVYVEVSKGFEIRPVRKIVHVKRGTRKITIEIERVLPWRERGWVSADTHVHFLSPRTAMLEGSGEGVNVVNLLASQWGELMTNAGDFDGKTTFGSREAGGDGEHLVRVGTENRQHVLGHISLLGYRGDIIAPMTTGGPDESAIGDPVGCLLTEWARQCKLQDGVTILPHYPYPRSENAAAILSGGIDAVEVNSRGSCYNGLNPYSLVDWYRYLNCGYMAPVVGGTDKMSAGVSVGLVRTYARIEAGREFTYDAWKDAIRSGNTFVTFGPLVEVAVDGRPPGTTIKTARSGGTVDVTWEAASVTIPMTRVDLIVNGEVRESRAVSSDEGRGSWQVKVERSSWMAVLVRGHQRGKPEAIAAHTSPVMVEVEGSPFFSAADAVTILEQVEGALAYIDTVGTRAETKRYREMRLVLTSAHRGLHNRLHQAGRYHEHTAVDDHQEHH